VLGGGGTAIRSTNQATAHKMNQPASFAIRSPCIKLCVIEPESGYCIGCGRSREEIGSWISLSPQQRDTIMLELPERLLNLTRNKSRRGGRRGRINRDL
jgi:predicted Fe-S protein YdhL (DUF1289 family)